MYRGEAWLRTCVDALENCKDSTAKQKIQLCGLAAAITNLQEHYATMRNSFEAAKNKLMVQHSRHKELLLSFDEDFGQLGRIAIDPSLVALFGGGGGGVGMTNSGTATGSASGSIKPSTDTSAGSSEAMNSSQQVTAAAGGGTTATEDSGENVGGRLSPSSNLSVREREAATAGLLLSPQPTNPVAAAVAAANNNNNNYNQGSPYATPTLPTQAMFSSPSPPASYAPSPYLPSSSTSPPPPPRVPAVLAGISVPGTLLDCIPLAKERVWYAQCVEVHNKVTNNLQELQALFDNVSDGVTSLASQAGVSCPGIATEQQQQPQSQAAAEGGASGVLSSTVAGGASGATRAETVGIVGVSSDVNRSRVDSSDSTDSGGEGKRSRLNSNDSATGGLTSVSTSKYVSVNMSQTTVFVPAVAQEANASMILSIEQGVNVMAEYVRQLKSTYSTIHNLIINCIKHQLHLDSSSNASSSAGGGGGMGAFVGGDGEEPAFLDMTSAATGMNTSFSQHAGSMTDAILGSSGVNEQNLALDLPALVTYLDSVYKNQGTNINANLKNYCTSILQYKDRIAMSQTRLLRLQTSHLRRVAELQTEMHSRLKKGIDLVKKWAKGHNQYFEHLDQLSKLPEIYNAMLVEIDRRRTFHASFTAACTAAVEDFGARYEAEVHAREQFMQETGKNLPPVFHQLVPSLRAVPDNFLYKLPEFPELPQVTVPHSVVADTDTADAEGEVVTPEPVVKPIPESDPLCECPSESASVSKSPCDRASEAVPTYASVLAPTASEHADLLRRLDEMTLAHDDLLAQVEALRNSAHSNTSSDIDAISSSRSPSDDHTCTTHATQMDGDTPVSSTNNSGNSQTSMVTASSSQHGQHSAVSSALTRGRRGDEFSNLDTVGAGSSLSLSVQLDHAVAALEHIVFGSFGNNNTNSTGATLAVEAGVKSRAITNGGDSGCSVLVNTATYSAVDAEEAITRLQQVLNTLTGGKNENNSSENVEDIKISFIRFRVNDYALFLPLHPKTPHVFMAFQQNSPHYYLSLETVKAVLGDSTKKVPYILGKIIEINAFEATNDNSSGDNSGNPYNLALGTIYYSIHVEVFNKQNLR